jgi:hypothetical protein
MKYLILLIMAATAMTKTHLTVKSPAFGPSDHIPARYTCDGEGINPELIIENVPDNVRTLALIMEDPDAAKGTFDHWIMWNIPVTKKIAENSAPGTQGQNGKKENKYAGPCPPSGTHHYHFKIYALDKQLDLPSGSDKKALLKAMEGHILGEGELIGLYQRK